MPEPTVAAMDVSNHPDQWARRRFMAAFAGGLLAAPLTVEGQSKRTPKIGVIFFGDPPVRSPSAELFWEPMRTFGWVEGQNVVVERRSAGGNWKQIQNRAAEVLLRADKVVE